MKKKPRKMRRASGRGTLIVISALLLGSAILRLGNDAGQALARAPDAVEVSALTPMPVGAGCEPPEDLKMLLQAFGERESRIEVREAAIRDRMHALTIADEEITAKLAKLQQADAQLRETISMAETASENDLDRLTRVYESMKPKQAAILFEEMDPNFAAGFLGRMRPEAAANIMAGLSPEAAHVFSVVLAGRNADVPSE